jgi:hypothetical protein
MAKHAFNVSDLGIGHLSEAQCTPTGKPGEIRLTLTFAITDPDDAAQHRRDTSETCSSVKVAEVFYPGGRFALVEHYTQLDHSEVVSAQQNANFTSSPAAIQRAVVACEMKGMLKGGTSPEDFCKAHNLPVEKYASIVKPMLDAEKKNPSAAVGSRIEIMWPKYAVYHAATVTAVNPVTGHRTVEYDDAKKNKKPRVYNLASLTWRKQADTGGAGAATGKAQKRKAVDGGEAPPKAKSAKKTPPVGFKA